MKENVGPEFARAPKSLIDILSPTSSDWANSWRKRCLENAARRARRLKDGDVIRLDQALEFNDGRKRKHFKVIIEKPQGYTRARTVFQCVETGVTCRISGFRRRAWDAMSPVGDPTEAKAATGLEKGQLRHGKGCKEQMVADGLGGEQSFSTAALIFSWSNQSRHSL